VLTAVGLKRFLDGHQQIFASGQEPNAVKRSLAISQVSAKNLPGTSCKQKITPLCSGQAVNWEEN
jgi:hypothetical protein